MIERVNGLCKKSFYNYTGPEQVFKRINIIFGYNGRGKTSLATGLIDQFKTNGGSDEGYRFYNRQYIRNNIMLSDGDDKKIKGVIANFGEKDINIEGAIKALQAKIEDPLPMEKEIKKCEDDIKKSIDNIHDRRKGSLRINKKPNNKSINEISKLYEDDLSVALQIVDNEEELRTVVGDDTYEKTLAAIDKIVIPEMIVPSDATILGINNVFERTFDDVRIPNATIINWIEKGFQIHLNEEKCFFCGGSIDSAEIETKLNIYKNNEKQQAAEKLIAFKKELESVSSFFRSLKNIGERIDEIGDTSFAQQMEEGEYIHDVLDNCIKTIDKKVDSIEEPLSFDKEALSSALDTIRDIYGKIKCEKETIRQEYNNKVNELANIVKGGIALEIKDSDLIQKRLGELNNLKHKCEYVKANNKKYADKIDDLKKSKSSTKDFAEHLTGILSMLEINIKLDLENDDYVVRHAGTDEALSIDDISEGEQNLLGLLYFYFELFEDKDQKTLRKTIELIVIDDPIASVDDVNKMYVLELTNRICKLKRAQVFVFTHVWDDFCNLCYDKPDKGDSPYRSFEIKKGKDGSFVEITKSTETPYKHNFKEIYEFSKNEDCSNMDDVQIYHYPNIMRKILEEFMMFKAKKHNPTQSNKGAITHVLCGDNPNSKEIMCVGMLLNVCNIMSHKAARNPDEILASAKFLMERIKAVDVDHFNAMIN